MKFAGVVCGKNQNIHRFIAHLATVSWQIIPEGHELTYTVVDYGSEEPYRVQLRALVNHFGLNLIEVDNDTDPWRHGRAFNIGIKASKDADVIFTTGSDLLLPPFFFGAAVNAWKTKKIVTAPLIKTRQDGEFYRAPHIFYGTITMIEKEWWFKRRGYDEGFTYWGREDIDLVERALADGFELVEIPETAWHQFHPARVNTVASKQNTKIYYGKKGKITRNPRCWGDPDKYCGGDTHDR